MTNRLEEDVKRLQYHMYGNGKEGVLIRLDRIEQSRLAWKDRIAIWIGPVVSGSLVAALQHFLK